MPDFLKPIKHVHDTGAFKYADAVLSDGKYKVGSLMVKACERFMNDLKRDDIYMDLEMARKVVNYPRLLNHYKGPKSNTPIILEPHQEFYFQQMFGWKSSTTHNRRFKRSYKQIARKEYKTTELAIMGGIHCQVEKIGGPQFFIAATTEKQARICLTDIANIVAASPNINKDWNIYRNREQAISVTIPSLNAVVKTISRDAEKEDGWDISFFGVDEWHAHQTTKSRDIGSSAMGNRDEPMEAIVTTAGFNISYPCYTKTRKSCIDILDGVIEDDQQLIIIYEMNNEEEWEDQTQWCIPNPSIYNNPHKLEYLKSEFQRAKNEGGSTEVNFKTKHLNIWCNSPETWIPHEIIKKNNHGITDEELQGRECYAGLDLSAGTDLNAYVLFFPNVRENIHAVKSWFWIPEDKLLSKEADYSSFKEHLEIFDGNTVEYKKIAHTMLQTLEQYKVKSWGCDPAYLAGGPAQFLWDAGKADLIEKVIQGRNLAAATNSVEAWAFRKELDLMNNPVLFWNFSNAIVAQDENGRRYPSKKKSQNKIDGVTALLTAVHEYLRIGNEPPPQEPTIVGIEW